jgi:hypothetical protein
VKTSVVALASLAVFTTALFSLAHAQRAVFLVRHADRLNEAEDSPLSNAGKARAQLLASLLKDAGITAIYTSPAKSSGLLIKTVEPLALALKIEPISILNTDLEGLFKRIRAENRNSIVLIVGTARSVPALLKLFGHPADIPVAPAEYDNLFVLVPKDTGPPMLLRLRY